MTQPWNAAVAQVHLCMLQVARKESRIEPTPELSGGAKKKFMESYCGNRRLREEVCSVKQRKSGMRRTQRERKGITKSLSL